MAKAITIKEALKRWEDQTKQNSTDSKEIGLQFQWPPIEKMDSTLSTLVKCEYDIFLRIDTINILNEPFNTYSRTSDDVGSNFSVVFLGN